MAPAALHSALTADVDLQLAVLRQLPTAILVLSSDQVVVLANRAAERLLARAEQDCSSQKNALGNTLADLGIELADGRSWVNAFQGLKGSNKELGQSGVEKEQLVDDLKITISRSNRDEQILLNASLSHLAVENEVLFVLSIDRVPTKAINGANAHPVGLPDSGLPTTQSEDRKSSASIRMVDEDSGGRLLKMRRAIFDSFDTAGFLITADEKFYLTNKKARQLVGNAMGDESGCLGEQFRDKLEIWNATFTERILPMNFPGIRLVRGQKSFSDYVCGFTHQMTGQRMATRVDGECLYDEETGELLGGVCWCRDLQECGKFLKDAQEKLLLSHETICDLMPHMVWTTRRDGYVDWYSKRWYEFTGMAPQQSIGYGYQQAIHHEDLPVLIDKWTTAMAAGNDCDVEVRYRRRDGVYRWMLARASPYRDAQGNVLKWYGTNTDIHDLVMARIEASRNMRQMLMVLAHAEVNLFAVDNNFKVTMAEGAMYWKDNGARVDKATFLGQDAIQASRDISEGSIPGMLLRDVLEPKLTVPEFENNIRAILNGNMTVAMSEDIVEGRTYRTRMVVDLGHDSRDGNKDPDIRGVLGLSIDVTDMKARAALELQNARLTIQEQSAQESSRMKSQFLANMSHEMRTPTAGVIGMVELLADDPTLTEEQREYVNSISLSAKALLTIVNDILDFSKIESGRLDIEEVPFNLSVVVGELCKLLGVFASQKGLDFVYENTLDEKWNQQEVLGDPGRIRQVLSNLLTNALKFTQNGSVTLSVCATETDSVLDVKFVVRDTGIGIDKKTLDKLFRPFSQGDASTARLYGGTGLGLTISRNLASLMNGSIELSSIPSEGSTATFRLPLKASTDTSPDYMLSLSPPNPGFRMHRTPTKIDAYKSPFQQRFSYQQTPASSHNSSPLARTSSNDSNISQLSIEDRSQIHVLVVEDNAINQTIALKTIRKLGFPVAAVWNGREALSYLRSPSTTQPRPSIILMDVQMPVMDGYEATRILRNSLQDTKDETEPVERSNSPGTVAASLAEIPVVAMTASAIQGDEEKCHAAGMDDYLSKPVDKFKLEAMLVKWANGKRR